jgi:hypothetical protein
LVFNAANARSMSPPPALEHVVDLDRFTDAPAGKT